MQPTIDAKKISFLTGSITFIGTFFILLFVFNITLTPFSTAQSDAVINTFIQNYYSKVYSLYKYL